MNSFSNRRHFLKTSVTAGLAFGGGLLKPACTRAAEPFARKGAPKLALSLAAYSFRDYFNHKDTSRRISLFDFLDFCAEHACQGAELTSYYFPAALDAEFLIKLKRHAFLRGLAISGGAIGNNFALPKGEKRD